MVVVGGGGTDPTAYQAARWTAAGGWQPLRRLGNPSSTANATSADGSVVVGWAGYFPNDYQGYPWRWTAAGGMQQLPSAPGRPNGNARGVSADGSIVVGCSTGNWQAQACRWLPNGQIELLGTLPADPESGAGAVSADGSVVVGWSAYAENREQAFRWTQATGMVGLGLPPGKSFSLAFDCNPDASVIVGWAYERLGPPGMNGNEAFRWTQATGMVGLGVAPGDIASFGYSVSADGSVVTGIGVISAAGDQNAIIWDAAHGVRRLQDVLENDYHLDLTGWRLEGAYHISDDGRTIVGVGIHLGQTEGWVAIVPEPATIAMVITVLALGGLAWIRRRRI
jgi:probable HAF family extracellular repeat protein